jgi:hypothetical protein
MHFIPAADRVWKSKNTYPQVLASVRSRLMTNLRRFTNRAFGRRFMEFRSYHWQPFPYSKTDGSTAQRAV